jgi:hypothetical protein
MMWDASITAFGDHNQAITYGGIRREHRRKIKLLGRVYPER